MSKLIIQPKVLGMVSTNCYILMNEDTKEIIIIDPADEQGKIIDVINRLQGKPVGILLTHGHFDHIKAAKELKEKYEISIYAHEAEIGLLESEVLNLSQSIGAPFFVEADIFVKDLEVITLGGFEITVVHTPGHTSGSCCYYFKDQQVMFTGDTLFMESVGRTDFPTSNGNQMRESLKRLFTQFPTDTLIYPGHMEMTSIEHEKRYNPYA